MLLFASVAMAQQDEQSKIDFADGLFKRGMYDMASDAYLAYLEAFPEGSHRSNAMYRLGESQFFNDEFAEALDTFDRVLLAPPDPASRESAALRKGEILLKLDKNIIAAEVLLDLVNGSQDEAIKSEAQYFLGKAHYQAGDFAQALTTFQSIVAAHPNGRQTPYARYQTALVYLAMNEPENAATEFAAVAKSAPDVTLRMESLFRAAESYDALGWHESSQAAYAMLREQYPDSEYAKKADYGYAWALYHAGRYADALKTADAFLKQESAGAVGAGMVYLRANCLNQQREYDAALAAYRSIEEQYADTEFAERSQYKIAWIHHMDGQRDEAKAGVTELLQVAKIPSVVGDAGFLLGTIFMEEGNYEDAEQEFNLLWENYKDSEFAPEALYKRAECLVQLTRASEAADAFKLFATTYPHNLLAGEAALRSGDAKVQMEAFDDAVAEYLAILESKPDPDTELETRYRLAVTYHNMKDYAASSKAFSKIVETFPESKYAAESRVRTGDYFLREGKDPTQALAVYEQALAADADGAFAGRALKGMALARYEIKDFDAAATTFLSVMNTYPSEPLNEATYDWVAGFLFSKERWQDAAEVYRAMLGSLKDYPKPEVIQLHIGECLERAGDGEAAAEEFAKVIELAPRTGAAVEATFRIAAIAEEAGDDARAFTFYEDAANANMGETSALARMKIAALYEGKEDFDSALRSYMLVVTLFLHEDLSPEALLGAGRCAEQLGQSAVAVDRYKELIEQYPDSEQTKTAQARLVELAP
jgi:TolA-binding protein